MRQDLHARSERVKFVYNAQFPASTAVVLDYLLHNPHFTGRQGRQQGMDAMMAFYRPLAEESRGELSVSEVQEVARHCVERLVKQIDELCARYRIANPVDSDSTPLAGDFSQLATVLETGFRRVEAVLASGTRPARTVDTPAPSLEQGVEMDGSELGDLEQVLG